jgi:hypothetical protein
MTDQPTRCPRCWARLILDLGALSRTTRDDGAGITVCGHCGTLEAVAEEAGQLAPFTDWPLSPEQLAAEERAWYAMAQKSDLYIARIDPDDARRMLGDPAPEDDDD